jgi:PrcB C-terminal
MRRPAVALLIVLLAGGAWIAFSERWSHGGGRPVAWRDLPGSLGAAELSKPVFLRFRKRRYLENYLAIKLPGRVPPLPPIDFTRDEALLAGVGARSSTGYSVHIVSVSDQRGRIVVRVRETTPSLGQHVLARVTYPYALATIPQSPKHVHFEWLGRP